MKQTAKKYTLDWLDLLYITVGSFLAALSYQAFMLPNSIVGGGVAGISTITYHLFGWSPALVQYALNIPLLLLCFLLLGKAAGYKTILGSLLMPFFIGLIQDMDAWTTNPMLGAIFGGFLTGMGIGIVFKAKASTGGTSIVAQIIHEYLHLPLGTSTALPDGAVIFAGLIAFNSETIMYSLIALFVITRSVDLVQVGFNRAKNVFIISDDPQAIREEILHTMQRGVTNLDVKGGYGNTKKDMLMCVVAEQEFTMLKDTVLKADPDAFVVVMSASEVWGRGFTLQKDYVSPE